MTEQPFADELHAAVEAARRAGAIVMELYENDPQARAKGADFNLVTEADLRAEQVILDLLKAEFPQDAYLSEEGGGAVDEPPGRIWVIDPLDGTNNYAHGFPFFAVSIALWENGAPIVGVVFDPLREERFTATRGGGAALDGEPIRVTESAEFPRCLLATGFYYDRGNMMKQTLRQIEAFFLKPIRGIRRTGSAALDICYVACGRLDGFWELRLSPWDYGAGSLIVQEAGGRVTDVVGKPLSLFMNNACASNGRIHEAMLAVTREEFPQSARAQTESP